MKQIVKPHFQILALSLATFPLTVSSGERSADILTRLPRPETSTNLASASVSLAKDEVVKIVEEVRASGYIVNYKIAQTPILVGGRPAVVLVSADQHTPEGKQKSEGILRFIRSFGARTLFLEGHSFKKEDDSKLKARLAAFAARTQFAQMAMTEPEQIAAGVDVTSIGAKDYTTPHYEDTPGYDVYVGTESCDMYNLALITNVAVGVDDLRSQTENFGSAQLTINGKYLFSNVARMIASMRELRSVEPLLPNFNALQRHRVEYKPGFTLEYISKEDFDAFDKQWGSYFQRVALAARNESCAVPIVETFTSGNPGSSCVALVMGRDHLTPFPLTDTPNAPNAWPTLLEVLASKGISSVAIFPAN